MCAKDEPLVDREEMLDPAVRVGNSPGAEEVVFMTTSTAGTCPSTEVLDCPLEVVPVVVSRTEAAGVTMNVDWVLS